MPNVYGLFSGLDLRAGKGPSIDVTTIPHAAKPSSRQRIAWTLSAFASMVALLLVAVRRRPRQPATRLTRAIRLAFANAHPADAVVACGLLVWWVLAPIGFDDGWVHAREQMFSSAGGFSNYYNVLGANLPLDYWLDWAHHWLARLTSAILLLRIPALACLVTTWVICRWCLARLTPSRARPDSVVLWALTCGFLTGAFAWGMTLRPEPVVALLATALTACMLAFLGRETAGAIAAAVILLAFALTAHTTGVVALAPIIVAAPWLFSWSRQHAASAATFVAAGCALVTVLAFVGSDAGQRRLEVQLSQTYSLQIHDEFSRYAYLNLEPSNAPIRRMAVGLLLLSVVALVLRRRRQGAGLVDFPAPVVAVGLLLLVATPSKWAWHFGAFIGIGAIAVAAETLRLRTETVRSTRWRVWPFVAIAAAAAVGSWSWWTSGHWNAVDLRVLNWDPRYADAMGDLAIVVPAYALLGAMWIAWRRSRDTLHVVPWRVASWTVLLMTIPVFAFTLSTFTVDAVRASSWTLARQNVATFEGAQGCGLADDVLVSDPTSARSVASNNLAAGVVPRWVPPPPGGAPLQRFALSPTAGGTRSTPWFVIPKSRRFGIFVAGTITPTSALDLQWGRSTGRRVQELRSNTLTETLQGLTGTAPWKFFAAGELPPADPRATHTRVVLRADVAPGPALAVTAPVSYRSEQLAAVMTRPGTRSLVYPELLPYFPCTRLPALRDGMVEVPQFVMSTDNQFAVPRHDPSSPFLGLLDLYSFERMPIADTKDWPKSILLFKVVANIPGAKLAAIRQTSFRS